MDLVTSLNSAVSKVIKSPKLTFTFPSNAEIKSALHFTSMPPIRLHGGVLRFTLNFYLLNMSDTILLEFTTSTFQSEAHDIKALIYFTYPVKGLKR
jgi:hypothetical protein